MTALYTLRTRTIFKNDLYKHNRYVQVDNLIRLLKIYDNSTMDIKEKVKLFLIILKETVDILNKDDIGKCRKANISKIVSLKIIDLLNNPVIYNETRFFGMLHKYLFKLVPEESVREQSYTR